MELYTEKAACCGCGACEAVCPAGAIQMKPDKEGFAYPQVDAARCTGCGRCEAVCPVKHPEPVTGERLYFGAQALDSATRKASSSGGLFPVLAEFVLKRQGSVFGAAFAEGMAVVHREARTSGELGALKKTKYVQSNLTGVFVQVETRLREGRWVLFVGTPCQVQALRLFLGREEPRLLLADLVCFGTPSPGLWGKYVGSLERRHKGKLTSFSFRDKRAGDSGRTRAYTVDGQEYACPLGRDHFGRLFFGAFTLRPACYRCRFTRTERGGDFTLGDFWGIEKVRPDWDDGMGTSLLILHTEKARRVWEELKGGLRWFPCEKKDLMQPRLLAPTERPKARGLFMGASRVLPGALALRASFFWAALEKVLHWGAWRERVLYRHWNKLRLGGGEATLLASNCVGTIIYYDMGLRYLSPTTNLAIPMKDFVKLAENPRRYMELELRELRDREATCPVGMLGDVRINFVHYDSFSQAAAKWEERKKRICWDNLVLMGTERSDCDYETLRRFDSLPGKKVVFTQREYPEFASAFWIRGFSEEPELGVITNYRPGILSRRYLEQFDYPAFLASRDGRPAKNFRRRG